MNTGHPDSSLPRHPTLDNWVANIWLFQCSHCMWFVTKANATQDMDTTIGRCRRHAPIAGGHGWPAVFPSDWCGDHKVKS